MAMTPADILTLEFVLDLDLGVAVPTSVAGDVAACAEAVGAGEPLVPPPAGVEVASELLRRRFANSALITSFLASDNRRCCSTDGSFLIPPMLCVGSGPSLAWFGDTLLSDAEADGIGLGMGLLVELVGLLAGVNMIMGGVSGATLRLEESCMEAKDGAGWLESRGEGGTRMTRDDRLEVEALPPEVEEVARDSMLLMDPMGG